MNAVDMALARRARAALEAAPGYPAGPAAAPEPMLLESLRRHLLAGETHYPERPGMPELRRLVGNELPRAGYPARGPDGVLITASEGESLFVALLGLGVARGDSFTGSAPGRHAGLFAWMGLARAARNEADPGSAAFNYLDRERDPGRGARLHLRPDASAPSMHAIGDRLFRSGDLSRPGDLSPPGDLFRPGDLPRPGDRKGADDALADVIVAGSLDGLRAMRPLRLGFVAAPPETLAGIAKWKQASSICSPAPSQRAALWALGVRP